jgi:hypothetical protein
MKNIPRAEHRSDFAFLVGDVRYSCPSFVAEFLSTRVCELHEADPTIKEYVVETEDSDQEFEKFVSLGYGEGLSVVESNRGFFVELSRELKSNELLVCLVNGIEGELSVSNALSRLILLKSAGYGVDEVIVFAASHFSEFRSCDLNDLSVEDLELILDHASLKLMSEDRLCDFVLSRSQTDLCFLALLAYVRFEYLSVESATKCWDFVMEHFAEMSVSILGSIRRRFLYPIVVDRRNDRFAGIRLLPVPSSPLDGIISHLSRRFGGNVHSKGIVTITGREPYSADTSHSAMNAADLTADTFFYSKNEPNQSLTYDFGDRRIRPSHYSIRSRYNGGENDHYLRSWVIEGCKDGDEWIELDRREGDSSLNARNVIGMFQIQSAAGEYRHVRLRQTGRNHYSNEDHLMVISGFELFGDLLE